MEGGMCPGDGATRSEKAVCAAGRGASERDLAGKGYILRCSGAHRGSSGVNR